MKTLTQKRQTSGSSGLKQSTSTFPLRNFLKHLEAGGERLVKAKMENHTIQCLSPHCHHTTGAFGEQVNKGLMEASVWATNMCRSVWTALFFSSIFQIKAIKRVLTLQQTSSRQICGPGGGKGKFHLKSVQAVRFKSCQKKGTACR